MHQRVTAELRRCVRCFVSIFHRVDLGCLGKRTDINAETQDAFRSRISASTSRQGRPAPGLRVKASSAASSALFLFDGGIVYVQKNVLHFPIRVNQRPQRKRKREGGHPAQPSWPDANRPPMRRHKSFVLGWPQKAHNPQNNFPFVTCVLYVAIVLPRKNRTAM